MARCAVPTEMASRDCLQAIAQSLPGHSGTHRDECAVLWYPETGHVTDPLRIVQCLVEAALRQGAEFEQVEVSSVEPQSSGVTLHTSEGVKSAEAAVICAGAWAGPLLGPLGFRVALAAARGYHVDLPGHPPLVAAPILYSDHHIVVTPMMGRLRASSFMDFVPLDAPLDLRKPARLCMSLARLGYASDPACPSWAGPRPVLPDYLPGLGRVAGTQVFYAIGHQHLGLTLAPVTSRLMADLVCGRTEPAELAAFDLTRFG